ncbi:MAG: aspartate--tRNA ligase [Candidatus Yanofskybacteria bacterium]|nr:aspartate--tRNA ligase [Candidatus Yanofskybacteria bacterium]
MSRTHIIDTSNLVGETVNLYGWVNVRRDQGKIIFIDLRDRSGVVQMVFAPHQSNSLTAIQKEGGIGTGQVPSNKELFGLAEKLRPEWVIRVKGLVKERPKKMVNPETPTGKVEIEPLELEILNEAETPPFPLDNDGHDIDEDLRRKYRYLDLRRDRMKENIMLRHKALILTRDYLNKEGFVEIETPTLTKTSPEGARDFVVPSRFHPGKFYALPQAPQQYKQLLMIAGFEKYYQLSHAFRDEDLRGDRQFEHTQIDMEMSFAGEKDVWAVTEGLMIQIVESLGKKITQKPFPVFSHEEAMEKFGADKFDLRKDKNNPDEFAFAWVTDFPLFEWDEENKKYTFAHNPFSAPKPEHVEKLMKGEDLGNLRARQYDLVCNGYELASGGVRISVPEVQRKVFEIMGLSPAEVEDRFGHLINAYKFGAPPHAGIAPGLDRLIMLLANEKDIREVIAFPMSARGQTSVMDAPSELDEKQLKELHIKIDK